MRKLVIRILAVIGLLTTLTVVSLVSLGLYVSSQRQKEPNAVVLVLNLGAPIVERNDPSPVDFAVSNHESIQLTEILRAIARAKFDSHVKSLVASFGMAQPSLAHAQEIRAAIKSFRESRKPTYAYASTYGQVGAGGKAYYLASAFENIWLQPVGTVSLNAPAIQSPFFKEALNRLGAKADFIQREEYKSFMDMAMRDDFSPPVRANMESMLTDMASQMASGLAESRNWDIARAQAAMMHGPYTDQEALQTGLVSHLGYMDELEDIIKSVSTNDAKFLGVRDYLSFEQADSVSSRGKEPTRIAVIQGLGAIVEHASDADSLTGDRVMGADSIVEAFEKVIQDKDIKGVLFRIDSPGGVPEASESIRRAVIRTRNAGKPVVVSMGNVAASGGYWAAMNADRIVADPGTITGSIGVVGGKFVIGPVLEKYGVRLDTIVPKQTAEKSGARDSGHAGEDHYATMWSMNNAFTPAQRERMEAMMDRTYQAFLENVAQARKIPLDKMPSLAKGRVYTGAQAQKLGLVDATGGYKEGGDALRELLKLDQKAPLAYTQLPEARKPIEKILKLLRALEGGGAGMDAETTLKKVGLSAPLVAFWQDIALAAKYPGTGTRLPFAESLTP